MLQDQNHSAGISTLIMEIRRHKSLLDQSIENDEILQKTKIIFQDLKILTEKLSELRKAALAKKAK